MSSPRVVTVIPCHNHRDWVPAALESVARQDYEGQMAVVVVDDGSTDGSSEEVVNHLTGARQGRADGLAGTPTCWVGNYPNEEMPVAVVRYPEAHGPSFARNRGMEFACGAFGAEILGLLDSDDIYEQGKLRKSVDILVREDGYVGAVYSDYETLRPDGLRVREFKEPFARERLLQECIVNCDSIVTRKAVEAIGGFDEEMRVCEDYDWWLRLSEKFLIFHIAEPLLTIRVGQHSSTAKVDKKVWERNWQRVMAKAQARAARAS